MADDGRQQRKLDFGTVVEDVKAVAMSLAMEAESILGRRLARFLGVLALFVVVVGTLLFLLDWYINPAKAGQRKDLILTVAQILGGTALLSGLYFTWRTLQVSREGQITDRFTRAIEQLGDQRLEIQLGGIYALERIARDSPARDSPTVMEVLTAYVRENAPWPPISSKSSATEQDQGAEQGEEPTSGPHPPKDIQAILAVLKRREEDGVPEKDRLRLDLQGTDLRGALLPEARFQKVLLKGADLRGADLRGADLQGADLRGADLRGAQHLTDKQIEWTIGSSETLLTEGLNRPKLWTKSIEEQLRIVEKHLEGAD